MRWVGPAIAAGVLLGLLYSVSPMAVWFLAASALLVRLSARGLPAREARAVQVIVATALAVRAALVAWLFLFGSNDHMWFNTFFGDEQYLVVRSLRLRALWAGAPVSLEGFRDVYESYGQTSYLNVIAFAQLFTGPAPYGVHLLNATLFAAGAVVLHRVVRQAYGRAAAVVALGAVLFWPSMIVWSASALKESMNVFVVMCVIAAAIAAVRARARVRALAIVVMVVGLIVLRTFRAGALEIAAAGIACGFIGRFVTRRGWRIAAATVVALLAVAVVVRSNRVHQILITQLRPAARVHIGHVFTRGHGYKLLDQYYYDVHGATSMDWTESVRFVRRALVSVVLYPLPWDSQSNAELAYVPEQIAWYVAFAVAVVGVFVGFRRDALVTSILAGYAATALIVVALNTGNIGTLVRHRALALPFVLALSAAGFSTMRTHARD
jgi:hypothetical protein